MDHCLEFSFDEPDHSDFFSVPEMGKKLLNDPVDSLIRSPKLLEPTGTYFFGDPKSSYSTSTMIPDPVPHLSEQTLANGGGHGVLCSESSLPTAASENNHHFEGPELGLNGQLVDPKFGVNRQLGFNTFPVNANTPNSNTPNDLDGINGLVSDDINMSDYFMSSQESETDNLQNLCLPPTADENNVIPDFPDTAVTTMSHHPLKPFPSVPSQSTATATFVPTIEHMPFNRYSPNADRYTWAPKPEDSGSEKQPETLLNSFVKQEPDDEVVIVGDNDAVSQQRIRRKRKGAMTEDDIQREIDKKNAKDAKVQQVLPSQLEKHERRKKQNREAAARCRTKKNGDVSTLEQQEKFYLDDNLAREQEIVALRQQLAEMKQNFGQHECSKDGATSDLAYCS